MNRFTPILLTMMVGVPLCGLFAVVGCSSEKDSTSTNTSATGESPQGTDGTEATPDDSQPNDAAVAFPGAGKVAPSPKVRAARGTVRNPSEGDPGGPEGSLPTFSDQLTHAMFVISGTGGAVSKEVREYANTPFDSFAGSWYVASHLRQAFEPDGVIGFSFNEYATPGTLLDPAIVGPATHAGTNSINEVSGAAGPTQIIDSKGDPIAGYEDLLNSDVFDTNHGFLEVGERYVLLLQAGTMPNWVYADPQVTMFQPFGVYRFDGTTLTAKDGTQFAWADVASEVVPALKAKRASFEQWLGQLTAESAGPDEELAD